MLAPVSSCTALTTLTHCTPLPVPPSTEAAQATARLGAAMPGLGYFVGGLIASGTDPRTTFLIAGIGVLAILATAVPFLGRKWLPDRENAADGAESADPENMVELIPVGRNRSPSRSESEVVS